MPLPSFRLPPSRCSVVLFVRCVLALPFASFFFCAAFGRFLGLLVGLFFPVALVCFVFPCLCSPLSLFAPSLLTFRAAYAVRPTFHRNPLVCCWVVWVWLVVLLVLVLGAGLWAGSFPFVCVRFWFLFVSFRLGSCGFVGVRVVFVFFCLASVCRVSFVCLFPPGLHKGSIYDWPPCSIHRSGLSRDQGLVGYLPVKLSCSICLLTSYITQACQEASGAQALLSRISLSLPFAGNFRLFFPAFAFP